MATYVNYTPPARLYLICVDGYAVDYKISRHRLGKVELIDNIISFSKSRGISYEGVRFKEVAREQPAFIDLVLNHMIEV